MLNDASSADPLPQQDRSKWIRRFQAETVHLKSGEVDEVVSDMIVNCYKVGIV